MGQFQAVGLCLGERRELVEAGPSRPRDFVLDGPRDVFLAGKNGLLLTSYLGSLLHVPAVFVGIKSPPEYRTDLAIVVVARLVAVGFLLSIMIKRFSRR